MTTTENISETARSADHLTETPVQLAGLDLAGRVIGTDYEGWSDELKDEFVANSHNYRVGSRLLSETPQLKVWEIRLAPGERVAVHRHVLDYFWTAVASGHSRQHTDDGSTREVGYQAGDTRHFTFAPGTYLLHDLENIGETELIFITVEHQRRPGDPGPRQTS